MNPLLGSMIEALKGPALKSVSEKSGITPTQGSSAIEAALPMILQAMTSQGGNGDMMAKIMGAMGGSQSNSASISTILGNNAKDVLAAVQKSAGIQPQQATSFLANLMPVIAGVLSKLGPDAPKMLSGAISSLMGNGGIQSLLSKGLDQDGDGDLDAKDLMNAGAKLMGKLF